MSRFGFDRTLSAALLCVGFCWCLRAQEASVPIQPLLKEGDSAFGQGNYEAARQVFERAWQAAQQLPGDSPIRYDVLKRLTSTSAASGQFADAEGYLEQAVAWRESHGRPEGGGPQDPKIADDLLLSVNLNLRTMEFDKALATAQRVQAMHVEAYTAESIPVADDLVRIGQIYSAEKKPKEAARSFALAIGVRTRLVGSLDPGLLPALDQINDAFKEIDGRGGSEAIFRQALAIRETLYGKDSTELISTIEGLAYACFSGGEYEAAEGLYDRLLSLWEQAAGKDHPMVAVTLDKLVVLYDKWNRPAEAREAMARSVAIREHFLAVGLSQQAAQAIAENHPDEAKALYKRALATLAQASPSNEELIAQIKEILADLDGRAKAGSATKQ
jgi:tetratricopeptide (TPR) repeat protein